MEPELAQFEMVDGKRKKYSARIWLDKGSTPRVIFLNGAHRTRSAHIEASKFIRQKAGLTAFKSTNDDFIYGLQHAKLPQVRIHHMYLRGPIIDHWPTRTQKEMIGGSEFDPKLIKQNLKNFLARTYRRPPTDEQIQSLHQIYTIENRKGLIHGRPTRIASKRPFAPRTLSTCKNRLIQNQKKLIVMPSLPG
jgi:hypothetical protein